MLKNRFTSETIPFLTKAGVQKAPGWLEKNKAPYETLVKRPFTELAQSLHQNLRLAARGYHFPVKGIGRLKRPSFKVGPGEPALKDWLSLAIAKPARSRFERNPHLFFGILPNESEWRGVFVVGGLYMPNNDQMKRVRQAIAVDATPFYDLFADPAFRARFKDGFSDMHKAKRVPRDYAADHPDIEWLKLKSFVVRRKLSAREFTSKRLDDEMTKDFTQLLRLNALLEKALAGHWAYQ